MKEMNIDEVKEFINVRIEPSITIYLPVHRKGNDVAQDPVRFKNLLRKTGKKLEEKGYRSTDYNNWLKEAYNLIEDVDFWNNQKDGLAFYISPAGIKYLKLSYPVEERIFINSRFNIKPVIKFISGSNEIFYILSLDLSGLRIFKCSRFNCKEIEIPGIPHTLEESQKYYIINETRQSHVETAQMQNHGAIQHGYGEIPDDKLKKKHILEVFRKVDNGVRDTLANENPLIILAGFEYLIPIYLEANSYSRIADEKIIANPQDLSVEELHRRGCSIIDKLTDQLKQDALTKYGNLTKTDKTSDDADEIIKAAYTKRIDSLFVKEGAELFGTFNKDSLEVNIYKGKEKDDLIDRTLMHTLQNNGRVFVVEPAKMPDGRDMAAIFRF